MALYVLGDTHFSEGVDKPMDIFGGAWTGSRQKLLDGLSVLRPEDTLVLAGDFSWGMNLPEALPDFQLLCGFPGRKLMVKGNHDYWWETVRKMTAFLEGAGVENIYFLHNNCFFYGETALCGSRGWFFDRDDPATAEEKIFKREVLRLEASLKAARSEKPGCDILAFLHYPPVFQDFEAEPITALLKAYGVRHCYYGHLHGPSIRGAFKGMRDGVQYSLISADAIGFKPVLILE